MTFEERKIIITSQEQKHHSNLANALEQVSGNDSFESRLPENSKL